MIENIETQFRSGLSLLEEARSWQLAGMHLTLRSNSRAVLQRIADYLQDFNIAASPQQAGAGSEQIEIHAFERKDLDLSPLTHEWPREAGKKGRKDTYLDLDNARLIVKVRTGMHFLQRPGLCLAAGPCLANDNQLINFINTQWMSCLQRQGWLIGHAAALVRNNKTLAIAGLSGGGKSTLMLKLLGHGGQFMSNDRLFLRAQDNRIMAHGIAKWPRINPGTIIHEPCLKALIPEQERARLKTLPVEQLRHLEQKYDAPIPFFYGPDHVCLHAPISGLLILNWSATSDHPTRLQRVELSDRLLPALMKSPGPFYQQNTGRFWTPGTLPPQQDYRDVLRNMALFELSGRIDFETAATLCAQQCWDHSHA